MGRSETESCSGGRCWWCTLCGEVAAAARHREQPCRWWLQLSVRVTSRGLSVAVYCTARCGAGCDGQRVVMIGRKWSRHPSLLQPPRHQRDGQQAATQCGSLLTISLVPRRLEWTPAARQSPPVVHRTASG